MQNNPDIRVEILVTKIFYNLYDFTVILSGVAWTENSRRQPVAIQGISN